MNELLKLNLHLLYYTFFHLYYYSSFLLNFPLLTTTLLHLLPLIITHLLLLHPTIIRPRFILFHHLTTLPLTFYFLQLLLLHLSSINFTRPIFFITILALFIMLIVYYHWHSIFYLQLHWFYPTWNLLFKFRLIIHFMFMAIKFLSE